MLNTKPHSDPLLMFIFHGVAVKTGNSQKRNVPITVHCPPIEQYDTTLTQSHKAIYTDRNHPLDCFAPCKRIQNSFHIIHCWFRMLCTGPWVCNWSLDSGFKSLIGFRIPWPVFLIPKRKILDSTGKKFPGFRTWGSLARGDRWPYSFLPISSGF